MNRRSFVAFALVLAACGASREEAAAQPTDRCAHCGMRIAGDWLTSGATTSEARSVQFDTPKCLFAWLAGDGAGASGLWVTEYYGRTHHDVEGLFYVDGSDVMGPMGADLIPIDGRDRADAFARDHGGNVLDLARARARAAALFR